jgi:hypothetical protein
MVTKTGAVVVAQFTSVATSSTTTSPLAVLSAGFYSTVPTPCALTTVGACQVQKCANTAPSTDQSAGVISITGGTPNPVTLTPSGSAYSPIMQNMLFWSSPTTLSVSAAGGGVPAFGGSVMAPAAITITNPPMPDQDMAGPPGSIPIGSDLTLGWTGGSAGSNVEFLLSSLPGDYLVRCSYPAQNGAAAVPSSLLTQMSTDGVTTIRMGASAVGSTMITAGDYKVSFLAINTANYNVVMDLE